MRFITILLIAVPFLAVSCGGSADPKDLTNEGDKALGSDDFAGALDAYESALEAIGSDTTHPQYFAASLGSIEARTKSDPDQAIADLKALAAAAPDRVTDGDYSRIGGLLGNNGHLLKAIDVVTLGKERFPEAVSLSKQVDLLGKKAEASDDPEAVKALKSLGYVGD
jgi:hypothetical protein